MLVAILYPTSPTKGKKLGAKITYLHCLQEIIWLDNILLVFLSWDDYFCCVNTVNN